MSGVEQPEPGMMLAAMIAGSLLRSDLVEKEARETGERHRKLLAECLPYLRSAEAKGLRARVIAALDAPAAEALRIRSRPA